MQPGSREDGSFRDLFFVRGRGGQGKRRGTSFALLREKNRLAGLAEKQEETMQSISRHSYWLEVKEKSRTYPPLTEGIRAEVAIIGAGITGLTAALRLKRAGRRVVVLEAGQIGAGTTGGTSAHLDTLPDQGCEQLIRDFGEDAARQLTEARRSAIDQIEQWTRELGIDCDFLRIPAYTYTESADGAERLHRECDAARRLGVQATLAREIGLPFETAGAVRFENQARFHPMKYLQALAAQIHGDGSTIYGDTRAEPPSDGAPCTITTSQGIVKADQVLIATHSAFLGISQFDMRMAPYQSYVVAAHVPAPPPTRSIGTTPTPTITPAGPTPAAPACC
jgi:glycine/D-amino acid oxidase-like deaminating enzyme